MYLEASEDVLFLITAALKQRRRRPALSIIEAERLDRIRNPSKYLGK